MLDIFEMYYATDTSRIVSWQKRLARRVPLAAKAREQTEVAIGVGGNAVKISKLQALETAFSIFRSGERVRAHDMVAAALADAPKDEKLLRLQLDLALRDNAQRLARTTLDTLMEVTSDMTYLAVMESRMEEEFDDTDIDMRARARRTTAEKLAASSAKERARKITELLRGGSYQAGREMLRKALEVTPDSVELLLVAFNTAIGENNEEGASTFLAHLGALLTNKDLFKSLQNQFSRQFDRYGTAFSHSPVLEQFGSRVPVNTLAGDVTGWGRRRRKKK